ncbi:DUF6062 family protein [Anaerotalea alkaliphila]|uniref:ABC transporter substrate-binding protein n=1 Tax=Anaerotalea alkaliphila TaxID=2662126 RepID=A0A7X5KLS9_9FIRM|nr:DUF6062 family protein [Anaerotalea alkaliphila]NDL66224.1 hypothetical protein [Anaerotalea alkaliphila]
MAKEKIYTIPVNDAFHSKEGCPLCSMENKLEKDALDFITGSAYMVDDIRMETDRLGFCPSHWKDLHQADNRLGSALMTQTRMARLSGELQKLAMDPGAKGPKKTLFGRQPAGASLQDRFLSDCFLCDRVQKQLDQYVNTLFHMWKREEEFQQLFRSSEGFCLPHFLRLYEEAASHFSGKELEDFRLAAWEVFFSHYRQVQEELDWFIRKFDYRFKDEPWGNSKDAPRRAIEKLSGLSLTDPS